MPFPIRSLSKEQRHSGIGILLADVGPVEQDGLAVDGGRDRHAEHLVGGVVGMAVDDQEVVLVVAIGIGGSQAAAVSSGAVLIGPRIMSKGYSLPPAVGAVKPIIRR